MGFYRYGKQNVIRSRIQLQDIYIGFPRLYPLLQLLMVLLSNVVTDDEGVFYGVLNGVSLLWCAFLIIIALMMIHVYTLGQTILSTLASILGMIIIALICLGFFSMFSEAVSFFASLVREIEIRVY